MSQRFDSVFQKIILLYNSVGCFGIMVSMGTKSIDVLLDTIHHGDALTLYNTIPTFKDHEEGGF